MSEKIGRRSRAMLFALLGLITVAALTMWGCGTDGYSDPAAEREAALDAQKTTTKTAAVIDAPTLKTWIDQGKLNAPTGNVDRVALISVTTLRNYTTASKLHIPGAALLDTGSDLYATRQEGQGGVASMVPPGAQMDTVIKRLGIDNNTTVVLTIPKGSNDSEHYAQSRAYFTFRYWGFDKNRIKILNGGDDAWVQEGYAPLVKAAPVITPTTYSVNQNSAGLKDVLRYSLTELIPRVDVMIADPAELNTWQIVEARGIAASTSPYIKNALRTKDPTGGTAHAMMFLTERVGGVATKNRLYPNKAALESLLATRPLIDSTGAEVFLSPTKKTIVMCGAAISASPSFVLFDAVLGVPEGNIMMYDGSSSQYYGYSEARLAAANPTATAAQISAWAFDSRVVGAMPTTGSYELVSGFLNYTVADPLMNQIESADKLYMTPAATTSGGAVNGSAGGGC